MSETFHPGQRWISESEPELGLGSVRRVTARTVVIAFGASDETREYARDNAPLRRVRFRVGDAIKNQADKTMAVQSVAERNGLIYYRGDGRELCETELSDAISFNKPEERLLAGQLDPTEIFDLRVAALGHQHLRRKSKVRGFVGGRIELIPHQLYIAAEVAGRLVPRVLLADEVGLGKTIEACLILHRLILTGRAQRVLILVPDSLVHQWFVELLRRFNLWFHIFDEERCEAIEAANPETNPFLDDQLILASIRLFTGKEQRVQQALAAGWDMLVVDEAHHLGWSPEAVSPEYAVVEALGRQTSGLLLLTATPEQLGMASHFARLRLLDPDRFYDLNEFIHEAESYREVARLAEKILGNHKLLAGDVTVLARILANDEASVRSQLERIARGDADMREELMGALLDQHGTGRVMFRNTRATISGFPKRIARLCPLTATSGDPDLFDELAEEFAADVHSIPGSRRGDEAQTKTPAETCSRRREEADPGDEAAPSRPPPHVGGYEALPRAGVTDTKTSTTFQPDFSKDVRLDWLADLLRSLNQEKVLLICRTQVKVAAIDAALRQRLNVKQAIFHEGLSLVQRDRNAAWFAEADGARILICSEIGSEGRNFQFAHHLVMFDLPLDPELLEQRIGRLDRIGQSSEIQVHVPYVAGSSQEVLARWYQEGLNSFEKNLHGGRELLERFGPRVHDLAQDFHETEDTWRETHRDDDSHSLSSPKGGEGRGEEASTQIPSPRSGGESIPPTTSLRVEPINREETFNIQHSTSNVQGRTFGPSLEVGSSMLNVECSQGFRERETEAASSGASSRPELDRLIAETQIARKELTKRLELGRDRLLELNSFRPETGARLVREIRQPDADPALDQFMIAVFDHFAIHVEELSSRTYQLGSAGVFAESFPGLPTEGLTITCDRQRALAREEIQFLTWDHPLVTGALDLLLGSEKGNSCFAKWPDAKTAGLYVETIFLLECIAPPPLHVDRFLPPTPLRVLVDHRGNDAGASITTEMLTRQLKNGNAFALLEQPELREELLPGLLGKSQAIASRQMPELIAQARKEMTAQLGHEIARLKELQKVNRSVRAEEINLLVEQHRALDQHLTGARLRLDAIRLIQRGPG